VVAEQARGDGADRGRTRIGHIEDAVAATTVRLSAEETARLEAPYRPHEVLPKRQ